MGLLPGQVETSRIPLLASTEICKVHLLQRDTYTRPISPLLKDMVIACYPHFLPMQRKGCCECIPEPPKGLLQKCQNIDHLHTHTHFTLELEKFLESERLEMHPEN